MINKKDSLINITEAEKKSFFRDGYHVIPSLLSCDKAKRFRYEINKLFNFPEEDIKSKDISYRSYALADGVTKKSELKNFMAWPIDIRTRRKFKRQLERDN